MILFFKKTGFTLVEILLAITIFGITISTLFAVFNTVISGIEPMKTGMDDHRAALIAMDRIKQDLSSLCLTLEPAYLPPDIGTDSLPDIFRFVSEKNMVKDSRVSSLRFASFEHITFRADDTSRIGIITYYVVRTDDDRLALKRSDTGLIFYDEQQNSNPARDPVLCNRVLAFELEFIDQNGEIRDVWDSDASGTEYSTPLAARIRLEVGDSQHAKQFETTVMLPVVRKKQDE